MQAALFAAHSGTITDVCSVFYTIFRISGPFASLR